MDRRPGVETDDTPGVAHLGDVPVDLGAIIVVDDQRHPSPTIAGIVVIACVESSDIAVRSADTPPGPAGLFPEGVVHGMGERRSHRMGVFSSDEPFHVDLWWVREKLLEFVESAVARNRDERLPGRHGSLYLLEPGGDDILESRAGHVVVLPIADTPLEVRLFVEEDVCHVDQARDVGEVVGRVDNIGARISILVVRDVLPLFDGFARTAWELTVVVVL